MFGTWLKLDNIYSIPDESIFISNTYAFTLEFGLHSECVVEAYHGKTDQLFVVDLIFFFRVD